MTEIRNLPNLPTLDQILDTLGHHIFALHAAAEALEKKTAYSKQKWLEVLLKEGITRYEVADPIDFLQTLRDGVDAAKEIVNEETSPPDASPPQL